MRLSLKMFLLIELKTLNIVNLRNKLYSSITGHLLCVHVLVKPLFVYIACITTVFLL